MLGVLFIAALLQAGGTVLLGMAERDLTGDGTPEILRLVGTGPVDNLSVSFTIEDRGMTIYRYELAPLTRTVGFDAGARIISAEAHRARVEEFGAWFFGDEKFRRPDGFVQWLGDVAPGRVAEIPVVISRDRQADESVNGSVVWQEIRQAPVTIFTFSPGGDALVAIGWHERTGRFYRLLDCC